MNDSKSRLSRRLQPTKVQHVDYDYFPAELHSWIDAIESELAPSDAEAIVPLYRWMIDQHTAIIELSQIEDENHVCLPAEWKLTAQAFAEALAAMDHKACFAICKEVKTKGATLPELMEYVMYPTMVEVGLRWERGEIDIAEEHRATAIVNKILSALYFDEELPAETCGVAVVSAGSNERHEMGAWMTATCLEIDGWDVVYLGADLPVDQIVATVVEHRAKLLALSIAMPYNLDSARRVISKIRADQHCSGIRIIVGGSVFHRLPGAAESLGADACLSNCMEAVRWATNLKNI